MTLFRIQSDFRVSFLIKLNLQNFDCSADAFAREYCYLAPKTSPSNSFVDYSIVSCSFTETALNHFRVTAFTIIPYFRGFDAV